MRGPAQTSEPIIQYLYQLIEAIAEGRLLIPRFQRPLVWRWDRQAELLRSVKDGIPMGAIMIWRTAGERIKSQEILAGHRLASPRPDTPHEYLLDGLQRLSTLFAALRGRGPQKPDSDEELPTIGYNLSEGIFVSQQVDGAQEVVPLSVLSDSVALLRYQRALKGASTEEWIDRSDGLAKAFREYKVPVIPIVSDDFDVAARTFNLVNSQGVRMGEADMIHALTWSPNFELRDRIESLRTELLHPLGWGEIDFETVLKVVKAEAGLDLYEESVEQVSRVLKGDPQALDRAFQRLASVAALLRTECGILDWDLVPYALQAVLLADVFRQPAAASTELLRDWFWLTTYGEMFAGLSGYRLGLAVTAIHDTVKDGVLRWAGAAPFRLRPLPATSDFRAVRIKALALQLARVQRQHYGGAADPFRILADHKRGAMVQLLPRRQLIKESYSSPGNRFLCPPDDVAVLRQRITSCHVSERSRAAHLISDEAWHAAVQGRWDEFIRVRLSTIAEAESTFVSDIVARHANIAGVNVAFFTA